MPASLQRRFWWTTLMVFVAMRLADVVNAVTGLWVIPRQLPQESLGAVLPLLSFGALFGLPITVLSTVLSRQLCTDLVSGNVLRAKGFLRDALVLVFGILILGLAVTSVALPWICGMLHIPTSPAAYLAVAYGLLAAFFPLLTSALQAAQRFKTLAAGNLLAAPVRLIAMLLLLPLCGLSGYFLGQLASLLTTGLCAAIALTPLLRTSGPCPFGLWRPQLRAMAAYGLKVALTIVLVNALALIAAFVIRHRLPDDATAAYYLLTRFAEIATYCGSTLSLVLFPFAVESHTQGSSSLALRNRLLWILLLGGALLSLVLGFALPHLFQWIPGYEPYRHLAWLSGLFTFITTLNVAAGILMTHAYAVNDFRFLRRLVPTLILLSLMLLLAPIPSLLHLAGLLFICAAATLAATYTRR